MVVDGIELFPVDVTALSDRDPVYIVLENQKIFENQWGIVDKGRRVTIHKDFTLSFNDKCKYYWPCKTEHLTRHKGVVVNF